MQFDSELSESRYQVVVSLFDQMVSFRLKELQGATKAIHDAEKKLKVKPNAQAADLVKQARGYAYAPLVGQDNVKNEQFLELFRKNRRDVAVSKQLTGQEELWASKAKTNYARATELANQAAALVK
ncbi:MAG: hypothetical protein EOO22_25260 [Comamonadaceae bacterium]|nr:MAG: hypothetical protein EOO22_25260 [Comamonadaceae bacterium]